MKPNLKRAYTGRSGQMALVAELLARGCNVSIPEVDVGEDLFAFQDGQPLIDRIQVKTAHATRLAAPGRYWAEVSIPLAQLRSLDTPKLYYVFPVRLEDSWADFVVISRFDLNDLHQNEAVGSENPPGINLRLRLNFDHGSLTCGERDMGRFRNAWGSLPAVRA